MSHPFRRPRLTVDRLLFSAMVAVVLLALFVGHDAPAVPAAVANEPVPPPAAVDAARPS